MECHHFHAQSAYALVFAVVVAVVVAVAVVLHYKVNARRAYFVVAIAGDDVEPFLLDGLRSFGRARSLLHAHRGCNFFGGVGGEVLLQILVMSEDVLE
jgi:hypothetical protein